MPFPPPPLDGKNGFGYPYFLNQKSDRRDIAFFLYGIEIKREIRETSVFNGIAHRRHELLIIMQVMPCQKHGTQHLLGLEQVMEITPGVVSAGGAATSLIQWARILRMAGVADIHGTEAGKGLCIAPRAGR